MRNVLLAVLVLNVLVAGIKLAGGLYSGSIALLGDAMHSLFDGLGNGVALVAAAAAARPPDRDHPYGHRKLEIVVPAVVGLAIILTMIELGRTAIERFVGGASVVVDGWTIAAAGVSLAIACAVALLERRAARRHQSAVLDADASHTAADAWGTLAVLGGFGLVAMGVPAGDLLATIAILVVLGYTAWHLLKGAGDVLMDQACLPAEDVRRVAAEVPRVVSCHAVRSRGFSGNVHVDMHVTFDPSMTLEEAGEKMLELKAHLQRTFPEILDIVVQLEPHLPQHLDS